MHVDLIDMCIHVQYCYDVHIAECFQSLEFLCSFVIVVLLLSLRLSMTSRRTYGIKSCAASNSEAHCITLYCIALHCIALHCIALLALWSPCSVCSPPRASLCALGNPQTLEVPCRTLELCSMTTHHVSHSFICSSTTCLPLRSHPRVGNRLEWLRIRRPVLAVSISTILAALLQSIICLACSRSLHLESFLSWMSMAPGQSFATGCTRTTVLSSTRLSKASRKAYCICLMLQNKMNKLYRLSRSETG